MSVTKRRPVEPIGKCTRGRYQTRAGRPVTVFANNLRSSDGDEKSVVGVVHLPSSDLVLTWTPNGDYYRNGSEATHDLFETVESGHRTKFVTYYEKPERLGSVYNSEREAVLGGQSNAIVVPIQIPEKEKIVIVAEAVGNS